LCLQYINSEAGLSQEQGLVSRLSGVAVLVAAKDAEDTIERAVASALAQPEAHEVVVVDDGSVDETAARARACDDGTGRLLVVSQPNAGPAAARNRAIALTRAPVLCVLDADDYFMPGRLAAVLDAAGADWDFAADELFVCQGERCEATRLESRGETIGFAEFVRGNISDPRRPRGEMGFLKPLMRRGFLEDHGLRYDETLRLGEDYALYAEALARGAAFRLVEACGYVAVSRPGSLSHEHSADDLAAMLRADERLAERADLTAADREVLARHHEMLRLKWTHRRALGAKAAGRLVEAFGLVFQDFATARYILDQTFRAKRVALTKARATPRPAGWDVAEVATVRRRADAA
jgi:succinoglycan biosynthesis protein ExoU